LTVFETETGLQYGGEAMQQRPHGWNQTRHVATWLLSHSVNKLCGQVDDFTFGQGKLVLVSHIYD